MVMAMTRLTVLTKKTVRKAKFSCSFVLISATIVWEEFIVAGGLWRLSPIVSKSWASTEESHHRFEQIL